MMREVWGSSFDLGSSECMSDRRGLHLRLRLKIANCLITRKKHHCGANLLLSRVETFWYNQNYDI
jgi:hypothetical protein